MGDPGFIRLQFFRHPGRIVANHVEQAIQPGPVDEREIYLLALNVLQSRLKVLFLALLRLADVIWDVMPFEEIKDVSPAVHSAGPKGAALFGEVEEGNVMKRNIIEIEIAAKIELAPDEL